MTIDTGGQAYPTEELVAIASLNADGEQVISEPEPRMVPGKTLLDEFAGQVANSAADSFFQRESDDGRPGEDAYRIFATACYDAAEAMIAEKRRREGG